MKTTKTHAMAATLAILTCFDCRPSTHLSIKKHLGKMMLSHTNKGTSLPRSPLLSNHLQLQRGMDLTFNVFSKFLATFTLLGYLTACGGGSATANTQTPAPPTPLSVASALFAEKALSASGQLACASCHTDENAHADATGTTLPIGGVNMDQQGFRSSPSLLYLASNSAFRFVNGLPFGGFTWDGRANSCLLYTSDAADE